MRPPIRITEIKDQWHRFTHMWGLSEGMTFKRYVILTTKRYYILVLFRDWYGRRCCLENTGGEVKSPLTGSMNSHQIVTRMSSLNLLE